MPSILPIHFVPYRIIRRSPFFARGTPPLERRYVVVVLAGVLLTLISSVRVQAQPAGRRFGIGGAVGTTPGATFKLYTASDSLRATEGALRAIDVTLSWPEDEVYIWSVHALGSRSIEGSPLRLEIGPGAVFGSRHTRLFWGISSYLGLYFEKHRFDVFIRITPRLLLTPDLNGEFGSAAGLRYYL